MSTVDYFDAWTRWAAGDPTLRDAHLWGLKIYWWARLGKVLAFLAGMALLVDIIGPSKVVAWFQKIARRLWLPIFIVILLILIPLATMVRLYNLDADPFSTGVIVFLALVFMLPPAAMLANVVKDSADWLAESQRFVAFLRLVSFLLFAIGFHFDMLGS